MDPVHSPPKTHKAASDLSHRRLVSPPMNNKVVGRPGSYLQSVNEKTLGGYMAVTAYGTVYVDLDKSRMLGATQFGVVKDRFHPVSFYKGLEDPKKKTLYKRFGIWTPEEDRKYTKSLFHAMVSLSTSKLANSWRRKEYRMLTESDVIRLDEKSVAAQIEHLSDFHYDDKLNKVRRVPGPFSFPELVRLGCKLARAPARDFPEGSVRAPESVTEAAKQLFTFVYQSCTLSIFQAFEQFEAVCLDPYTPQFYQAVGFLIEYNYVEEVPYTMFDGLRRDGNLDYEKYAYYLKLPTRWMIQRAKENPGFGVDGDVEINFYPLTEDFLQSRCNFGKRVDFPAALVPQMLDHVRHFFPGVPTDPVPFSVQGRLFRDKLAFTGDYWTIWRPDEYYQNSDASSSSSSSEEPTHEYRATSVFDDIKMDEVSVAAQIEHLASGNPDRDATVKPFKTNNPNRASGEFPALPRNTQETTSTTAHKTCYHCGQHTTDLATHRKTNPACAKAHKDRLAKAKTGPKNRESSIGKIMVEQCARAAADIAAAKDVIAAVRQDAEQVLSDAAIEVETVKAGHVVSALEEAAIAKVLESNKPSHDETGALIKPDIAPAVQPDLLRGEEWVIADVPPADIPSVLFSSFCGIFHRSAQRMVCDVLNTLEKDLKHIDHLLTPCWEYIEDVTGLAAMQCQMIDKDAKRKVSENNASYGTTASDLVRDHQLEELPLSVAVPVLFCEAAVLIAENVQIEVDAVVDKAWIWYEAVVRCDLELKGVAHGAVAKSLHYWSAGCDLAMIPFFALEEARPFYHLQQLFRFDKSMRLKISIDAYEVEALDFRPLDGRAYSAHQPTQVINGSLRFELTSGFDEEIADFLYAPPFVPPVYCENASYGRRLRDDLDLNLNIIQNLNRFKYTTRKLNTTDWLNGAIGLVEGQKALDPGLLRRLRTGDDLTYQTFQLLNDVRFDQTSGSDLKSHNEAGRLTAQAQPLK